MASPDVARAASKKDSEKVRRMFRRVVINDDGSGEVEYEARNPWECVVIPLTDLSDLFDGFWRRVRLS